MAVDIKIQMTGDETAMQSVQDLTTAELKLKNAFEAANKSKKAAREEVQKLSSELLALSKRYSANEKEIKDISDRLETVLSQHKELTAEVGRLNKKLQPTTDYFKKIRTAILQAAIVETFRRAVIQVAQTTASFQKLEATLTTALGSRSKAQEALRQIRDFAAVTPFQVDEIAQSFNKLANRIQGIKFDNNQFTALGDLSSALGKDLEQLIEAILDVNNTERWTELGIKVKTEGDKITGTFKGVTKTFDRTEEGALQMAQAFGQLEGVQGGMALQAATLGGQYSNLLDNSERLALVIGERLAGAFAEAIQLVNNLVNSVADYVEVPLSGKLQEEQSELNILVGALINTADEQGNLNLEKTSTSGLLDELNDKYPSFLTNIKSEEINVSTLRDRLKEVNDEYLRKILLQSEEERLAELAQKRVNLEKQLIDAEKGKARAETVESKTTVTFTRGDNLILGDERESALSAANSRLEVIKRNIANIDEEFAETITNQDALFERFGINRDEYYAKVEENTTKTSTNTTSQKENNDAQKEALRIAKLAIDIQRSEIAFLLEKNQLESNKSESPFVKIELLKEEARLKAELIELDRKTALLSAKSLDEKKLVNQDANQSLELLKIKTLERNQSLIDSVKGLASKRIDIEKLTNKTLSKLSKDNHDRIKKQLKDEQKAIEAKNRFELAEEERKEEQKQRIITATADLIVSLGSLLVSNQSANIDAELERLESKKNHELKMVGDSEKGKALVQSRYDAKRRVIKEKEAKADRERALFQIVIDSIVNAVKLFAQTTPPGILSAFALAQGAIQATAIKKVRIPKYYHGTESLKRGDNPIGRDTIPILAHEKERIVPSYINAELGNVKNVDLPKLVHFGRLFLAGQSDTGRMTKAMTTAIIDAIASQPKISHEWNEKGVEKWIITGQNKVKDLNDTFKL